MRSGTLTAALLGGSGNNAGGDSRIARGDKRARTLDVARDVVSVLLFFASFAVDAAAVAHMWHKVCLSGLRPDGGCGTAGALLVHVSRFNRPHYRACEAVSDPARPHQPFHSTAAIDMHPFHPASTLQAPYVWPVVAIVFMTLHVAVMGMVLLLHNGWISICVAYFCNLVKTETGALRAVRVQPQCHQRIHFTTGRLLFD